LGKVPMWVFVDWAETDKQGQVTALNALYVAALGVAADLARLVEHERAAHGYDQLRQRVSAAINHHLWDEERGVYADARRDGRLSRRLSQQSNAAVIAFGVAPAKRWARMFTTVLDADHLVLTNALDTGAQVTPFDEDVNVVQAQPFYGHFLHGALRRDGRFDTVLAHIRDRWGGLLADGAATLRETWQVGASTSHCHAWSATPTFDLSTDVLGVTPIAPGMRRLRIAPQTAGLDWACGRFPTPHGEVSIDWQASDGKVRLELTLPAGCEADVLCPGGAASIPVGAGHHVFIEGIRNSP
jgi:hypothetical protein